MDTTLRTTAPAASSLKATLLRGLDVFVAVISCARALESRQAPSTEDLKILGFEGEQIQTLQAQAKRR